MKKKRIIALSGGIGNQMFQYAFARALQTTKKCEIEFDTDFYGNSQDRKLELTSLNVGDYMFASHPVYNRVRRFVQRIPLVTWLFGCYKEYKEFEVDPRVKKYDYRFYTGYWQNTDYFLGIADTLRNELKYMGELSSQEDALLNSIRKDDSIAVHVRRGDYRSEKIRSVYVTQDEEYYHNAIDRAKTSIRNDEPVLYFFSDDIEWCRNCFSDYENAVFVDNTISSSPLVDMLLMQNAKCLVMSNSTFSWWSAWLSDRKDKVVLAPLRWYRDDKLNIKAISALINDNWLMI